MSEKLTQGANRTEKKKFRRSSKKEGSLNLAERDAKSGGHDTYAPSSEDEKTSSQDRKSFWEKNGTRLRQTLNLEEEPALRKRKEKVYGRGL